MPKRSSNFLSDQPIDSTQARQTVQRKVMDMLARRDHSEDELRQKLQEKFSELKGASDLIDEAIDHAKRNNWMGEPSELSRRLADTLHQRNKGIEYINNYLQEKGLPPVESDSDFELEKALGLVKNKYSEEHEFTRDEKAKVARFLASRGFDSDTVRKVVYEKLWDS